MRSSKFLLSILAAVSTLSLAQSPEAKDAPKPTDYKKSIIAKGVSTISAADKSLIASNILCQNLPVVGKDKVAAMETYSGYIFKVSDLFANNAKDIESHVIGINQDNQMAYTLVEPVSIVGINFDVVNINRLKDVDGNYYQFTAIKPLVDEDAGKVKNIPVNDNLTLSTKDKQLSIICNIRLTLNK
ncbi:hypothetical protein DM558_03040 [Entomomonas moraniae]|uniref:Uncharacterized protein n=1 Tax=Entomomonas moraniae TaxID=2213226 RepID=A0A3Q9JHM4_9GAMM|nr:hypothetical protein [Entomomonas moraniae]AZS49817.1 hypothetical protein DM558_03040 [Entomomonas moraniae]